jgi:hypothetical protein
MHARKVDLAICYIGQPVACGIVGCRVVSTSESGKKNALDEDCTTALDEVCTTAVGNK